MIPLDGLKIRELQKEDISDIVEMTKDTWGGNDYISFKLGGWLKDPHCYMIVGEYSGKVISLASLRVMEDNRTGWMEGLRVHPDFQKRGLGKKMTDELLRIAERLDTKRVRLGLALQNPAPLKIARGFGLDVKVETKVFWKSGLDEISWRFESIDIHEIDKDKVADEINLNPSLFPKGLLIYHWYAVDARDYGIDEIRPDARFWFGKHDENIVSFMVAVREKSVHGDEYFCTIYAKDNDSFLSTLTTALETTKQQGIPCLVAIYNPEFKECINEIEWLEDVDHELRFAILERELK